MFHKEGTQTIVLSFLFTTVIALVTDQLISTQWIKLAIQVPLVVLLCLILFFFRNPKRKIKYRPDGVIAPADGKIVVIQKIIEKEYFDRERIQVSIFLSPLNVHVTRYPVSGEVILSDYQSGKYLVAWHPKSSTLNERSTVVVKNLAVGEILYRQIAGYVARRIVNYAYPRQEVTQGMDSGFIKFGSRVDLFLPIDLSLNVEIGQHVKGGIDLIAEKRDQAIPLTK